jgi:hypothetical protein
MTQMPCLFCRSMASGLHNVPLRFAIVGIQAIQLSVHISCNGGRPARHIDHRSQGRVCKVQLYQGLSG